MLKLSKRSRDKTFKMRGTINGRRVEESTGFADKASAQQVLNARNAELDRHRLEVAVLGRSPAISFAEAIEVHLAEGGSKRFLNPLFDELGTVTVDKITQELVNNVARKLYPKASPATINRQVYTPISSILRKVNVFIKFKRPQNRRPKEIKVLTQDQAYKLISVSAEHLRPLIVFLLFTGARIGEALWLDWSCVSFDKMHVIFPKTKTGKPRGLPLHPDVIAALSTLTHRQGEIFRRPDGQRYKRLSYHDCDDTSAGSRIKTSFKSACRRAGLSNVRVHDLRHTWATWHYEQNHNLLGLMTAGGWTSLKMVQRYTHYNTEELRTDINALPTLMFYKTDKIRGVKTG